MSQTLNDYIEVRDFIFDLGRQNENLVVRINHINKNSAMLGDPSVNENHTKAYKLV
jgi:hypothetical protein